MTLRERRQIVGLIALSIVTIALAWWQITYRLTATRAVQQYIALQGRNVPKDQVEAQQLEQTRSSVTTLLTAGNFSGALERLTQLSAFRPPTTATRISANELTPSMLWPPGSPERKRARQLLLLLTEKQNQGYDVTAARLALREVARLARNGDKKAALTTFDGIEALLKASKVRSSTAATGQAMMGQPGVGHPSGMQPPTRPGMGPPPGMRPPPGGGQMMRPPMQAPSIDSRIASMVQFFEAGLPQVLSQAPAEQRPFLLRLQAFGKEFVAAYRQGKDLRAVVAMMEKAGQLGSSQDVPAAIKHIDQALIVLRQAPTLSSVRSVPTPGPAVPSAPRPAAPGVAPVAPRVPVPRTTPPVGGRTPTTDDERLLQLLDTVRSLPEPAYRQQRAELAAAIAQLTKRKQPVPIAKPTATPKVPVRTPAPRPTPIARATPMARATPIPTAGVTLRSTPGPTHTGIPPDPAFR